ncbi:MAG: TlpA family protein disulfide reductase [Muribaculaceae bacterium]|nr:TlpA family protein disulfide reductase [Muribaculaceae bacterium]
MKKIILTILVSLGISGISQADINVTIAKDCPLQTINYYYAPIKQYAAAKTRAERGLVADSVAVVNSKAVIAIPTEADSYLFGLNLNGNNVDIYAAKGDNVNLDVTSCNPFTYSLSGTGLAEGMNELHLLEAPVMAKAYAANSAATPDSQLLEELAAQFINIQKEFIAANPDGPAVGIALMNLDGEDFINTYESLPASFNNSILFPLADLQYQREKKSLEMEKKQQELQAGAVPAPSFTLKDLQGKDVSLSDFKGKWVILDFWGSWCPWCIKGFPELKEAYKKYAPELEIIGIDCRESQEEWKAGVEKYQLPWVNVYNPEGTTLLSEYGVQGFPTKAIINPEGKIANITVGHNPEFFTILTNLMGK